MRKSVWMGSPRENDPCPQETFYNLCKDGREIAVKETVEAANADLSGLFKGTLHRGTCLHATVIGGNSDLLEYFLSRWHSLCQDIAFEQDCHGNTVMHLAVMKNREDLVKQLMGFQPQLCSVRNNQNEPPLFVAVRMGVLEVVKALVDAAPHSVHDLYRDKNVLHLAVELYHVLIVRFLTKHKGVNLRKIINHGIGLQLSDPENPQSDSISQGHQSYSVACGNESSQGENDMGEAKGEDTPSGDTALHIAARNKCLQMVNYLLDVPEVDKYAVNHHGFTPLDIAKENTEYYESYEIIAKLSDYPKGQRPFMYNAPSKSLQKLKNATKIVNDVYRKRQNIEIVVAALLATMTFTAVFQVPGGFHTEHRDGGVIGTPTLIAYTSFKLFLGFDVVAFFVALFVVYLWQMRQQLTMREKILVMRRNNQLLCTCFVFTSFGFISALYVVLAQKRWVLLFIVPVVCTPTYYLAVRFLGRGARFSRLCGVCYNEDDIVDKIWRVSERLLLIYLRWRSKSLWNVFTFGLCRNGPPKREAAMIYGCGNGSASPVGGDGYSSSSPMYKESQSSA